MEDVLFGVPGLNPFRCSISGLHSQRKLLFHATQSQFHRIGPSGASSIGRRLGAAVLTSSRSRFVAIDSSSPIPPSVCPRASECSVLVFIASSSTVPMTVVVGETASECAFVDDEVRDSGDSRSTPFPYEIDCRCGRLSLSVRPSVGRSVGLLRRLHFFRPHFSLSLRKRVSWSMAVHCTPTFLIFGTSSFSQGQGAMPRNQWPFCSACLF